MMLLERYHVGRGSWHSKDTSNASDWIKVVALPFVSSHYDSRPLCLFDFVVLRGIYGR